MTTDNKNIAIIGVGNSLMGDEGVGVHAIKYLEQFDWADNVELIDAGVPGPALLHILEGRTLSIIIDCADFKHQPGDILVIPEDRLKKEGEKLFSLHETDLLGTLALANEAEIDIGRVILICIQPRTIEITQDLSEEVTFALPKIREEVMKLV